MNHHKIMKTKKEAQKRANEVRAMMDNPKIWKVDVWKNIYWHCMLYCANEIVTLRVSHDGKFFCMIAPVGSSHSGSYDWHSDKTFRNPNTAVRKAVDRMKEYRDKLNAHCDLVKRSLK